MEESVRNFIRQIQQLSARRQLVLLATAVGSLGFFLWISLGMGSEGYRPLFRGLSPEETARVADVLRGEKIEYALEDGSTTISVPASALPEARIRVASKGLPGSASSGFELFDRPAFGVTDFVHRVNFVRAVQGELTRSIEQLAPVARARVQVVIPERGGVLSARKRQPSAAVVVRLEPGQELDAQQTRAIVHLVASSIESLDPADVTVVDGTGRLLAPLGDEVQPGKLPVGGAPAHQARVESELATRIEAILEPVVGIGGVVARVSADMDWTESNVTEERFDPDSQVARSETRSDEFEPLEQAEGGTPGIEANTPGPSVAAVDEEPSGSTRVSETLNYEISKTVSHKVTAMGSIKRLSVAVLIDSEGASPTATPDGASKNAPAEWPPEAIAQFERLAREAVGYSEERGDRIVVTSAPFRSPEILSDEGFMIDPNLLDLLAIGFRIAAQLLALFIFIRFVAKPIVGVVSQGTRQGSLGLPASVSNLEASLAGGGAAELPSAPKAPLTLADQVSSVANLRRDDSITTIRSWLNQG